MLKIIAMAYIAPPQRATRMKSAVLSVGLSTTLDVSGTKVEDKLAPMMKVFVGGIEELSLFV